MEGVLIATVTGIFAILQVWTNARVGSVKKKVEVVRSEVQNDHSTNLRDELDGRHNELQRANDDIISRLQMLDKRDLARGQDIHALNGLVRDVDAKLDAHVAWSNGYTAAAEEAARAEQVRIDDLEQTIEVIRKTS